MNNIRLHLIWAAVVLAAIIMICLSIKDKDRYSYHDKRVIDKRTGTIYYHEYDSSINKNISYKQEIDGKNTVKKYDDIIIWKK